MIKEEIPTTAQGAFCLQQAKLVPTEAQGPAFIPRPIQGDASFGHLLTHQRRVKSELGRGRDLDEEASELLPLMLSLARLSARGAVMAVDQ